MLLFNYLDTLPKLYIQVVALQCCPNCLSLHVNTIQIGEATSAIGAAIKNTASYAAQ